MGRRARHGCVLALFCALVIACIAQSQAPVKQLTKGQVVQLLTGDVPAKRIQTLAVEHGIDFQITPGTEQELRKAGADDALISVLTQLAPKAPLLIVTTVPGGAEVLIDGKLVGVTIATGELRISTLQPGGHYVLLTKKGYYDRGKDIDLKGGETLTISEKLLATPPGSDTGSHANVSGTPSNSEPTIIVPDESVAAELYRRKCAGCHGSMGQGRVGPSLQNASLGEKEIADLLVKGSSGKKAPHGKPIAGLSLGDARGIAIYVETLHK